jgi:hypothetical protein
METLMGLCIGVGLASACGFRVFVPLLALSLAAKAGFVTTGENLAWIGSWPAVIALATGTVLEVGAYFVPWVDHALDTVSGPAAVVAGTLAAASQLDDVHSVSPFLQWGTALVAGGGAAGATKLASVATRGTSTVTTGGTLNPIISAVESAISAVLSFLAIAVPVCVGLLVIVIVAFVVRRKLRARRARLALA